MTCRRELMDAFFSSGDFFMRGSEGYFRSGFMSLGTSASKSQGRKGKNRKGFLACIVFSSRFSMFFFQASNTNLDNVLVIGCFSINYGVHHEEQLAKKDLELENLKEERRCLGTQTI